MLLRDEHQHYALPKERAGAIRSLSGLPMDASCSNCSQRRPVQRASFNIEFPRRIKPSSIRRAWEFA